MIKQGVWFFIFGLFMHKEDESIDAKELEEALQEFMLNLRATLKKEHMKEVNRLQDEWSQIYRPAKKWSSEL